MEYTKKQLKNMLYKKKLKCIVPGCHAVRQKRGEPIMHRLPKCPLRRKLWLTQIRRLDLTSISPKTLNKCYHVCNRHFKSCSYSSTSKERLTMTAFPEISLGPDVETCPNLQDIDSRIATSFSAQETPEIENIFKIEETDQHIPDNVSKHKLGVGVSIPRLVSSEMEQNMLKSNPRKRQRNGSNQIASRQETQANHHMHAAASSSCANYSSLGFFASEACLEDLFASTNSSSLISDDKSLPDVGNSARIVKNDIEKNGHVDKEKLEMLYKFKTIHSENLELKKKIKEMEDRYLFRNHETLIHDILQDLKQAAVPDGLYDFVQNQLSVPADATSASDTSANCWTNPMKSWAYAILRESPNAYFELSKVFKMPCARALISYRTQQEENARRAALQIYGAANSWTEEDQHS